MHKLQQAGGGAVPHSWWCKCSDTLLWKRVLGTSTHFSTKFKLTNRHIANIAFEATVSLRQSKRIYVNLSNWTFAAKPYDTTQWLQRKWLLSSLLLWKTQYTVHSTNVGMPWEFHRWLERGGARVPVPHSWWCQNDTKHDLYHSLLHLSAHSTFDSFASTSITPTFLAQCYYSS